MIGVRIEHNLPEFQRWIRLAQSKQIPFATALALTRVAKLAREDVVLGLPGRFVVRGGKLAQSIRYKPANKRQWPRIESTVYTLAEALELQETGGIKRPRGRSLGVPGRGVRPTPATRITPSKRPKAILRKRGGFLQTISKGKNAGADAILQRVGRARYPLRVAYLLRPQARIKPALGMEATVRARVELSLSGEFLLAMDEAFASAKPKGARAR